MHACGTSTRHILEIFPLSFCPIGKRVWNFRFRQGRGKSFPRPRMVPFLVPPTVFSTRISACASIRLNHEVRIIHLIGAATLPPSEFQRKNSQISGRAKGGAPFKLSTKNTSPPSPSPTANKGNGSDWAGWRGGIFFCKRRY